MAATHQAVVSQERRLPQKVSRVCYKALATGCYQGLRSQACTAFDDRPVTNCSSDWIHVIKLQTTRHYFLSSAIASFNWDKGQPKLIRT